MLTGPQALHSLNDALREIRREENQINARVLKTDERIVELNRLEAEQFKLLAGFRLCAIDKQTIANDLDKAEKRATKLLQERDAALAAHHEAIAELEAQIDEEEQDRKASDHRLEEVEQALDSLSDTVAEKLKKDKDFSEKAKQAQKVTSQAVAAANKYEIAQQDRTEKSKPYQSDPLFMYLWQRQYDTPHYKASNLVRTLDGWVAGLIRFQDARPNFSMLNEIPDRLKEHAHRQKKRAQEAQQTLETLEHAALKKAGADDLEQELNDLLAQRAQKDAHIVELEDTRDALMMERQMMAQGEDEHYKKALDIITANLRGQKLVDLYQSAYETPTEKDEAVVSQIEELRERRKFERTQNDEDHTRFETLSKRRRELENIQWEFKKERFDDPLSSFDRDELVSTLLTEFLRGAISAVTYWGHFKSSQKWRKRKNPGFGGKRGFPDDLEPFLSDVLATLGNASHSSRSLGGFSRKRRKANRKHSKSRKGNKSFRTGGGF